MRIKCDKIAHVVTNRKICETFKSNDNFDINVAHLSHVSSWLTLCTKYNVKAPESCLKKKTHLIQLKTDFFPVQSVNLL